MSKFGTLSFVLASVCTFASASFASSLEGKFELKPGNSKVCPASLEVQAVGKDINAHFSSHKIIEFPRVNEKREITSDDAFVWRGKESNLKKVNNGFMLEYREGSCNGLTSMCIRIGSLPLEYLINISEDQNTLVLKSYSSRYLGHDYSSSPAKPKLGEQKLEYSYKAKKDIQDFNNDPFYKGVDALSVDCSYQRN